MPKAVTWFLFYLLLHTFIIYALILPIGESNYTLELYEGESWFTGFERTILFTAFAYALATYLKTERQFQMIALLVGASLLLTLLIGRQNLHTSGPYIRSMGGFTNPNYFGSVLVTAFFLNLAVWVNTRNSIKVRAISILFVLTSLIGCFMSGSRGSLFSLFAGLFIMLSYMPGLSRRIRASVGLLFIIILAVLFIPVEMLESIQSRLSIESLLEDKMSGRLDIWAAYIARMPRYFLTGVGYGRSCEIVMDVAGLLGYSTHDQYLLVLAEQGIVGLILFVLGLYQIRNRLSYPSEKLEYRKVDAVYQGFYVAWLFLLLTGTYSTSRAWWFSLGVIAAYSTAKRMRVTSQQIEKKKDVETNY